MLPKTNFVVCTELWLASSPRQPSSVRLYGKFPVLLGEISVVNSEIPPRRGLELLSYKRKQILSKNLTDLTGSRQRGLVLPIELALIHINTPLDLLLIFILCLHFPHGKSVNISTVWEQNVVKFTLQKFKRSRLLKMSWSLIARFTCVNTSFYLSSRA